MFGTADHLVDRSGADWLALVEDDFLAISLRRTSATYATAMALTHPVARAATTVPHKRRSILELAF